MRANNGLFTDAFMNLGYLGAIIYPFIYALLLKISDKIVNNINDELKIFVAFIIFYLINSTSLSTALITHGILLTIFMVHILTRKHISRKASFKR